MKRNFVLFLMIFCLVLPVLVSCGDGPQRVENNFIYPRVVGTSVGLSGMWVLIAIAIGGKISGVVGMFLMIPMAAVLYVPMKPYFQGRDLI